MIKAPTALTPRYKGAQDGIHISRWAVLIACSCHHRIVLLWNITVVHVIMLFMSSQDCIGEINGTHVSARVSTVFKGRKHYTSLFLISIWSRRVLAGREGPSHDASILAYSIGLDIHVGLGFLHPLGETRYPINEFWRNNPKTAIELFKLSHSSLRTTVERAFATLKNRFKILYHKPFHPFTAQVKFVLSCCILHNWILGFGLDEHVL
jgi:hypothetical protein